MACAGVTVVKRARPCSAACVLIASCPQVKATGWAASKAKLLDEACARAQGNGRSLALEQRWGKLLVKVMQGVGSEQFCMLAQELVEPKALLELSLHPHGSQVLQAVLRQLALFLSLPEMAVPCENASCSRQAVCNLLRSLYDAARATLLQEDTLQQLLADVRGALLLCDLCSLAGGYELPDRSSPSKARTDDSSSGLAAASVSSETAGTGVRLNEMAALTWASLSRGGEAATTASDELRYACQKSPTKEPYVTQKRCVTDTHTPQYGAALSACCSHLGCRFHQQAQTCMPQVRSRVKISMKNEREWLLSLTQPRSPQVAPHVSFLVQLGAVASRHALHSRQGARARARAHTHTL